ncbi:hypothetical protein [Couchioplanes caeruleus]|uniref:Uncharacterized protein n=2 Tax=Couchioplanes caeruleus TaxID=56438 RepID=A0A1K0H1E0_9ACTN|nr:hypothetical protein [Couchioplanes caeruleus]OJF15515.1 hypothetical protein BG844_04015 [Couchioplanes caeruleus subsp. caeruleus]ROP30946.1 hypothetical protein EDD30_3831 [Couchioplanes caeruleus]
MTRCWDGTPETPAETRFFNLRESGYDGPIDSDGYRVTDPDVLATFARMDAVCAARMADEDEQ